MQVLIDGDVVCYYACKPRVAKSNRPELVVTSLDDEGIVVPPEYTEEDDAEYLEECWAYVEDIIAEIQLNTFSDSYKMAVKGEGNFREDVFEDYKHHRRRQPNPLAPFVKALRLRMVEREMAVPADNMEADDYLRIWAEGHRRKDKPFVIASIDKDLKCIVGPYYNIKKKTLEHIDVAAARHLYYAQLLSGDPVDNIKGLWKVGPVNAEKMVEGCETHEEYQEAVVSNYLAVEEDNWLVHLQLTGRLIYLLKSLDDKFDATKWPLVQELME